jgi:hypothetical protein
MDNTFLNNRKILIIALPKARQGDTMDHLYIKIRKYSGDTGEYLASYFEPSNDLHLKPELILWRGGDELVKEQKEEFVDKDTIEQQVKHYFNDSSIKEVDSIRVPDTSILRGVGNEISALQKIINEHLNSTKPQKQPQYDKD